MRKAHAHRLSALSAFGLAAALMSTAPMALAQQAVPPKAPAPEPASTPTPALQAQEEMAGAEEFVYEPLQVGDATQGLLAWQRSGDIASTTPRPIAGNVANRSYERYLKSFEFPIPERMGSTVKSTTGSGGGGSGGGMPK
ncbi:DUF3613 domain-containing protein [Variovorax paradoxus]|jgi:hypothetical protein|uniref:DUF3613 domain-containing protein n=1 Tax=Variovorax paradoxus TaxID=34073 RepID=UPI00339B0F0B